MPVDLAISERLPTVPLSAPFRRVLRAGHAGLLCAERVADAFDVGSLPVELPYPYGASAWRGGQPALGVA
ncbi:MAG: hypothetical protein ACJ72M_13540 [Propionibacteriaceae bacterium]